MSTDEFVFEDETSGRVFIPLQGLNGQQPKAPKVIGWQSASYEGIDPSTVDGDCWVGLRTDDLVVIDCDNDASARAWMERVGPGRATWVRKTPHGYHFIYRWTPGSPDGPKVGVFPKTDVRAGRTSQIVFHAPGYGDVDTNTEDKLRAFEPAWLPEQRATLDAGDGIDEWSEMPSGRGNNTMTSIAGACRRQGMDMPTIYATLKGINKLTMTREPMPDEMLLSIAMSVSRYTPDPDIDIVIDEDTSSKTRPLLIRSDQVPDATPTEWLWKPYLPAGHVVMLDGEEGIGKGMFGVWMTMQMLTGKWGESRGAVWITTEDSPADLKRRMVAAGYDPQVHPPALFWDLEVHWPSFKHAHDLAALKGAIEKYNIGVVFLDPGRSFFGASDYNDEAQVRPVLEKLRVVADSTGALIVFIHHHNKMNKQGTRVRERVSGSGAYRQVVRHQVTMSEVEGQRAFAVAKSNLGDVSFTVRRYHIELHAALDSACFVLGDPVDGVRDIDAFNDQERSAEIEVDVIDEVREALRQWRGDKLPEAKTLHKQFRKVDAHVTQEQVTAAFKGLIDEGELVEIGNGYRWTDSASEAAEED